MDQVPKCVLSDMAELNFGGVEASGCSAHRVRGHVLHAPASIPKGRRPVCSACGAAREAGAAVDVHIDERFRRDGRRRPIAAVDAGRVATGDWQRRGCGGTLHLLYDASARVVLYVVFWDLGGRLAAPRLRRRVGVDLGGSVTCVRGGCACADTGSTRGERTPKLACA